MTSNFSQLQIQAVVLIPGRVIPPGFEAWHDTAGEAAFEKF